MAPLQIMNEIAGPSSTFFNMVGAPAPENNPSGIRPRSFGRLRRKQTFEMNSCFPNVLSNCGASGWGNQIGGNDFPETEAAVAVAPTKKGLEFIYSRPIERW